VREQSFVRQRQARPGWGGVCLERVGRRLAEAAPPKRRLPARAAAWAHRRRGFNVGGGRRGEKQRCAHKVNGGGTLAGYSIHHQINHHQIHHHQGGVGDPWRAGAAVRGGRWAAPRGTPRAPRAPPPSSLRCSSGSLLGGSEPLYMSHFTRARWGEASAFLLAARVRARPSRCLWSDCPPERARGCL